jgi:hypothetical protein
MSHRLQFSDNPHRARMRKCWRQSLGTGELIGPDERQYAHCGALDSTTGPRRPQAVARNVVNAGIGHHQIR